MVKEARFRVYDEILGIIKSGSYKPGSKLPNERELAKQYKVARTEVRDALLVLQKEGMVERRVGDGTYLSDHAPQIVEMEDAQVTLNETDGHGFQETLEARLMFEPAVVALATKNITPEAGENLKTAANAVGQVETWFEFKEAIYAFSRQYYVEAGNDFLLWTFDQILKARRQHNFDGKRGTSLVSDLVKTHMKGQLLKIAEAICSGDSGNAEKLVHEYLVGQAASSAH